MPGDVVERVRLPLHGRFLFITVLSRGPIWPPESQGDRDVREEVCCGDVVKCLGDGETCFLIERGEQGNDWIP